MINREQDQKQAQILVSRRDEHYAPERQRPGLNRQLR
jgi:hypothetical protein